MASFIANVCLAAIQGTRLSLFAVLSGDAGQSPTHTYQTFILKRRLPDLPNLSLPFLIINSSVGFH